MTSARRAGSVIVPTTTPRYERVMNSLRERIAAEEFEPTGKLPSTSELVAQYGWSTQTIRKAIETMTLLGELRAEQGVGVFRVKKD